MQIVDRDGRARGDVRHRAALDAMRGAGREAEQVLMSMQKARRVSTVPAVSPEPAVQFHRKITRAWIDDIRDAADFIEGGNGARPIAEHRKPWAARLRLYADTLESSLPPR